MLKNFLGLYLARFACSSRDFSGGTEFIRVEHFLRVVHPKSWSAPDTFGKVCHPKGTDLFHKRISFHAHTSKMNYLWAFHTPTLTIFYGSGLWNLEIIPQTYHACILYCNPPTLEFYFYIAYLKSVEISSNHESFVFEYIPVVTTSRPIFFPTKEALCNKKTNKNNSKATIDTILDLCIICSLYHCRTILKIS